MRWLALSRIHLPPLPLGLVLALIIAVPGLVAWFQAKSKAAVTSGAIVAFVGTMQVLIYGASHVWR